MDQGDFGPPFYYLNKNSTIKDSTMAAQGIRISQLQELFAITDKDVFVINDENTNTMKITYRNLVNSIQKENLIFDGDIIFNGSTNIESIDGGNALGN